MSAKATNTSHHVNTTAPNLAHVHIDFRALVYRRTDSGNRSKLTATRSRSYPENFNGIEQDPVRARNGLLPAES